MSNQEDKNQNGQFQPSGVFSPKNVCTGISEPTDYSLKTGDRNEPMDGAKKSSGRYQTPLDLSVSSGQRGLPFKKRKRRATEPLDYTLQTLRNIEEIERDNNSGAADQVVNIESDSQTAVDSHVDNTWTKLFDSVLGEENTEEGNGELLFSYQETANVLRQRRQQQSGSNDSIPTVIPVPSVLSDVLFSASLQTPVHSAFNYDDQQTVVLEGQITTVSRDEVLSQEKWNKSIDGLMKELLTERPQSAGRKSKRKAEGADLQKKQIERKSPVRTITKIFKELGIGKDVQQCLNFLTQFQQKWSEKNEEIQSVKTLEHILETIKDQFTSDKDINITDLVQAVQKKQPQLYKKLQGSDGTRLLRIVYRLRLEELFFLNGPCFSQREGEALIKYLDQKDDPNIRKALENKYGKNVTNKLFSKISGIDLTVEKAKTLLKTDQEKKVRIRSKPASLERSPQVMNVDFEDDSESDTSISDLLRGAGCGSQTNESAARYNDTLPDLLA